MTTLNLEKVRKYFTWFFNRKKYAYVNLFRGENSDVVLKDLIDFCGYKKSSYAENPHEVYHREGRREVILRILSHLNMTEDEINQLIEKETAIWQSQQAQR